ncbi:MAG: stage II sporulation protein D [Oscillospiraceae bacterium]|jgi:stage II sporulation protein D|nr:stage II sporulation protein D [Oscillospiraceae bacterium]
MRYGSRRRRRGIRYKRSRLGGPSRVGRGTARVWFRLILILLLIVIPGIAGERFEAGRRIMVYDTKAAALVSMPLELYVERALAAEMPASYHLEALKAQAVAARTRAIAGHCSRYPEANVCTDSGCCQAYLDDAAQRVKWSLSYPLFRAKLERAVVDTAGEIITYNDEPILVLYHAISGGRTEDVELVFSEPLPYLRGVDSPGEEFGSKYKGQLTVSREKFVKLVNDALPDAGLTAESLESQVEILVRSASNRALATRLGGASAEGRKLRSLFGLNSANFTIAYTAKEVIFDTVGYGHGVGMSQVGAEAMARAGANYLAILTHYYTGVQVTDY